MGKNRWDINSSFNVTAADIIKAYSPPLWGHTHGHYPSSDAPTHDPWAAVSRIVVPEEHSVVYRNKCFSQCSTANQEIWGLVMSFLFGLLCFINNFVHTSQAGGFLFKLKILLYFCTVWEHQISVRVRQSQRESIFTRSFSCLTGPD